MSNASQAMSIKLNKAAKQESFLDFLKKTSLENGMKSIDMSNSPKFNHFNNQVRKVSPLQNKESKENSALSVMQISSPDSQETQPK